MAFDGADQAMFAEGDRVRVRLGSNTAKLIYGFSPTGVVRGVEDGTLWILLDDGQPVDGTPTTN